jgi:hypothetical protein
LAPVKIVIRLRTLLRPLTHSSRCYGAATRAKLTAVGPPGVPKAGWSFLRTLRAYTRLYRRSFVHGRRLVRTKSVVRLCAQVLNPQLWRCRYRKTVPAIALAAKSRSSRRRQIPRKQRRISSARAAHSRPPTTNQILGTPRRYESRTPLVRPRQRKRPVTATPTWRRAGAWAVWAAGWRAPQPTAAQARAKWVIDRWLSRLQGEDDISGDRHDHAAVRSHRRAGDGASVARTQEGDHGRDSLWLGQTLDDRTRPTTLCATVQSRDAFCSHTPTRRDT